MFGFLSFLFWPLLIIGVIYVVRSRGKRDSGIKINPAVLLTDSLMLLSVGFLGIGLYNLTKDLGLSVDWDHILLFVTLVSFWLTYKYSTSSTLVFSVISLGIWWLFRSLVWTDTLEIKPAAYFSVIIVYTIFLYLASFLIDPKKNDSHKYILKILGLVPILIALFAFSSIEGLRIISQQPGANNILTSSYMVLSFTVVFLSAMTVFSKLIREKRILLTEKFIVSTPLILFTLVAFLPSIRLFYGQSLYSGELNSIGFLYATIFNAATFVTILSLIMSGYSRSDKLMADLGLFSMFVFVFIKYFDWFFSFLDKSLFFLGAGILLFVFGWFLERGRGKVLGDIKNDNE